MNSITRAIVRSGLIPTENLAEFRKWGLPIPKDEEIPPAPTDPEKLVQQLDQALQQEDMVIIRETDLNVVHTYLKTMKAGTLHLVMDDDMVRGEFPVAYGVTETGEYIMPWQAEAIDDMMVNGLTYLLTTEDKKVYFNTVRELFFGTQKAFMLCKVSSIEESNGHQQAVDAPQE